MSDERVIDGVDYGPLAVLIGAWRGEQGSDVAPGSKGSEVSPFYESLLFEPVGLVTNAEMQNLAALRYHQVVSRKSNDAVFHNQTGYWMWDPSDDLVMQSLTIPRGVCLVAGGVANCADDETVLTVRAALGDPDWGVVQPPFMRDNASTVSFDHRVTIRQDRLQYFETTVLDIYGERFDHTDENTLVRNG